MKTSEIGHYFGVAIVVVGPDFGHARTLVKEFVKVENGVEYPMEYEFSPVTGRRLHKESRNVTKRVKIEKHPMEIVGNMDMRDYMIGVDKKQFHPDCKAYYDCAFLLKKTSTHKFTFDNGCLPPKSEILEKRKHVIEHYENEIQYLKTQYKEIHIEVVAITYEKILE